MKLSTLQHDINIKKKNEKRVLIMSTFFRTRQGKQEGERGRKKTQDTLVHRSLSGGGGRKEEFENLKI